MRRHDSLSSEDQELYPWSMLNFEGAVIKQAVMRKWLKLLGDENCDVNVYREFLAKCALLFFDRMDYVNRSVVISELELGNGFVVDFAVTQNKYSRGVDYHLIKIESPHISALTEYGALSETLSDAIHELEYWKSSLDDSSNHYNVRLFPSAGSPNFTFWVFIGLDDEFTQVGKLRHTKLGSVQIATFRYFTKSLELRRFEDIIHTGDGNWYWDRKTDLALKNRISCPFFKALPQNEWLRLTKQYFSPRHIISKNARRLLEILEDNGLTETFVHIWNRLPEGRRNSYLEELRSGPYGKTT